MNRTSSQQHFEAVVSVLGVAKSELVFLHVHDQVAIPELHAAKCRCGRTDGASIVA